MAAAKRGVSKLGRARGRHPPPRRAAAAAARRRAARGRDAASAGAGRARRRERLDGRRLESVEARREEPRAPVRGRGRPPLAPADERPLAGAAARRARVAAGRGSCCAAREVEGVLWNGPVLELHTRALARLGPDILASPPDFDAMLARMRARGRRAAARRGAPRPVARRRDREHVDGRDAVGARLSPWLRLRDVPEDDRRRALETAARLMRAAVEAGREPRAQRLPRAGRPCPRCGDADRSRGARATRTAPRTGARTARSETGPRRPPTEARRVLTPCSRTASPIACGRSASPRSPPSAAPTCRSRSRSTRRARGRRCTSTGRSCAAFVETRRRRCAGCPTRGTRSTTCAASPPPRSSRTRTRGLGSTDDDALFRTILLPLLSAVAERCGGFDWHDDAFDIAYAEFELSLFGTARSYAAVAPLVGLSAGATVELGGDIRVRAAVTGEVASLWPEARGLMPPEFGRDVDRLCVLELARELDAAESEPPDAAGELADAVSALRLATAGAIAAGPVVFERLDFRPLRISPLLPIAGDAAARRGDAARRAPRPARRRPARAAAARRRRPRARRGARPLGAVALLRGAVPLGAGARGADRAARRRRRRVGGGRCGRRSCSARRRRTAPTARRRSAPRTSGATARDAVRRALVEVLLHGEPRRARADARRDAARPAAAAGAVPRGLTRRPACGRQSRSAQSRHRHVTARPATVEGWTRRRKCWSGCERIDALERAGAAAALLGELRALVREAEAWARLEGDARARSAVEKLREGAEGMS